MAELSEIVANAVHAAETGGAEEGNADAGSTGDQTDSNSEPSGDGDADTSGESVSATAGEAGTTVEKLAEPDEVDKELETLGIKAPRAGERENRLPHSRVKKIFTNAQKKWAEAHLGELKTRDEKITQHQQELENFRRADELLASDPDRYISMLAAIHPDKYKKYVSGAPTVGLADTKSAAVASVAALGPRPAPDHKFEDGSTGYTPEQHEKLLDWVAATAEAKAVARTEEVFTKRFGPIEKEWQSNRAIQEKMPVVRAQTAAARKRWGKLYEDEEKLGTESGLYKYLTANQHVPFDAAVADYLLPKIHTDRDKIRAELTTEMNARPAAAARTVPTVTSGVKDSSTGERSIEQVIRDSITHLKR